MKKLFLLSTAALMFTGAAFACDGKKCSKDKKGKKETAACCAKKTESKETAEKDGKEKKACCAKKTTAKLS